MARFFIQNMIMKNKNKIYTAIIITAAATAAFIVLRKKNEKQKEKLAVISEAGYETAHDMHFPLKVNRIKKRKYY